MKRNVALYDGQLWYDIYDVNSQLLYLSKRCEHSDRSEGRDALRENVIIFPYSNICELVYNL